MKRLDAMRYVKYVVNDAGSAGKLGATQHAIVRNNREFKHASKLVGWINGDDTVFVAVHSYLDVELLNDEAEEMAADYLDELGYYGALLADGEAIII